MSGVILLEQCDFLDCFWVVIELLLFGVKRFFSPQMGNFAKRRKKVDLVLGIVYILGVKNLLCRKG